MVTIRTTILPCTKVISWLIKKVDIENILVKYAYEKSITLFQPSALEFYYKFPQQVVKLMEKWILQFSLNCWDIFKSWWVNPK